MTKQLKDKVVVVTGGGSGIGRSLCLAFADAGAHVVAADLNQTSAEDTVRLAPGQATVEAARLDVTELGSWNELKESVDGRLGGCDVLCNNAGVYFDDLYLDSTLQQWTLQRDVNVNGVIYGCDTFVPGMVDRGNGHVINTASIQGLIGVAEGPYYSAAKFAVVGFTHSLRAGLDGTGVRTSVLCPDVIDTPMNVNVDTQEVARRVIDNVQSDDPALHIFTSHDYLGYYRQSISGILEEYEASET